MSLKSLCIVLLRGPKACFKMNKQFLFYCRLFLKNETEINHFEVNTPFGQKILSLSIRESLLQ